MIRKNPRSDLPLIHPRAIVDPTAILCGLVIVEENVFIGPYAVIHSKSGAIVHGPCTVRHDAVVDGVQA